MEARHGCRLEGGPPLLLDLGDLLGGLLHLVSAVAMLPKDGFPLETREMELAP